MCNAHIVNWRTVHSTNVKVIVKIEGSTEGLIKIAACSEPLKVSKTLRRKHTFSGMHIWASSVFYLFQQARPPDEFSASVKNRNSAILPQLSSK